jgi:hypothetical protein
MGKGWGANYSGLGPPKFPNGRPVEDTVDDVRNGKENQCQYIMNGILGKKRCPKDRVSGNCYCVWHKNK